MPQEKVSVIFSKFHLQIRYNFEPEASGYGSKFYQIFAVKFGENPLKAFPNSGLCKLFN